jgi:hypothetical protein
MVRGIGFGANSGSTDRALITRNELRFASGVALALSMRAVCNRSKPVYRRDRDIVLGGEWALRTGAISELQNGP